MAIEGVSDNPSAAKSSGTRGWSVVSADIEDNGTVTMDGEIIGDIVFASCPNDTQFPSITGVSGADVTVDLRTASAANSSATVTTTVVALVE